MIKTLVLPAPTTLTLPFVVPARFTALDLVAVVWQVAGLAVLAVVPDDDCDSCSCTRTVSLLVTFRLTPLAFHKTQCAIYEAAKRLGAYRPDPFHIVRPLYDASRIA